MSLLYNTINKKRNGQTDGRTDDGPKSICYLNFFEGGEGGGGERGHSEAKTPGQIQIRMMMLK